MKYLVTGGAGFIGSNLVDRLIKDGNEVIVIDDLSTGNRDNLNENISFYQRDISLMTEFDMFENVDVVFHLAAKARVQPSIENPIEFHNTNVNGTLNLLKACVDYGVKRFVFSSSSSVYGDVEQLPTTEEAPLNPKSPYALQKQIGEQYCKLYSKLYGLDTVCLRYFNVYGERQPTEGAYCLVMGIFAGQRLNGEPMTIRGDGEQRRDFTYVGDVVDANIKAATSDKVGGGDGINIGNGDNRSVNQIADLIGGDRVNIDPVIEPRETLAHNGKAKFLLDWRPTMELEDWMPKWKEDLGL
jgi:UDP-glucose 4-epimerase